MSETTPQGSAAMSPASAGSVPARAAWDGVPVLWAAIATNGQPLALAFERHDAGFGSADVVPLYRSPTLTDAEREAVGTAARIAGAVGESDVKATLRGLLERFK